MRVNTFVYRLFDSNRDEFISFISWHMTSLVHKNAHYRDFAVKLLPAHFLCKFYFIFYAGLLNWKSLSTNYLNRAKKFLRKLKYSIFLYTCESYRARLNFEMFRNFISINCEKINWMFSVPSHGYYMDKIRY